MAYFDSPKNKAFWEKELEDLKKERARRQLEGYDPNKINNKVNKKIDLPARKLVTLAQLEMEEMEARGIKRVKIPVVDKKTKQIQMEPDLKQL